MLRYFFVVFLATYAFAPNLAIPGIGTGLGAGQTEVLAWIPYVRNDPEYANVQKVLGYAPPSTTTTDPSTLERLLAGKCVLLIPEQQETSESTLESLGRSVAGVLRGFLNRGGTIIGMTFAKGAEDILRGAGFWECDDDYNMTDDPVVVVASGHPLVAGVASRFTAADGATDFTRLPTGATVIIADPRDNAPVVFEWRMGTGKVIMLGFDFFRYNDSMARLLRNAVETATCGQDLVLTYVTVADIEALLREMGITYERRTDSAGDPMWVFRLTDTRVVLYVYDENPRGSGRYGSLLLYAAWTGRRYSCTELNDWNARKRGSRAYLDADGDPVLEADLYLMGGVTRQTIRQFIERFDLSVREFRKQILGI